MQGILLRRCNLKTNKHWITSFGIFHLIFTRKIHSRRLVWSFRLYSLSGVQIAVAKATLNHKLYHIIFLRCSLSAVAGNKSLLTIGSVKRNSKYQSPQSTWVWFISRAHIESSSKKSTYAIDYYLQWHAKTMLLSNTMKIWSNHYGIKTRKTTDRNSVISASKSSLNNVKYFLVSAIHQNKRSNYISVPYPGAPILIQGNHLTIQ